MKTLFTLILFFVCVQLSAQKDIDSLTYVLENYRESDTLRVNLLNKLGYEYWVINPAQSEIYGEEALVLAKKLEYNKGKAFANRVIGVAHWARGNYEKALDFLFEGMIVYRNNNDQLGQANCLMNIGLVFADQHNEEKALKYYFDAVEIFNGLNKIDRVATTYNKIATIYLKSGTYDQAYSYLVKALDIHQQNNFNYGVSETNNRLGLLFMQRGDYNRAFQYLFRSYTISTRINDRDGMAKNLENLGQLYLKKSDYDSAIHFFDRGRILAEEIEAKKWLKEIYAGLKQVYEEKGNYKLALDYANKYNQMRDSLFNEEMATHMANMQTQIETVEKEKELELQANQITLLEQQMRYDTTIKWFLSISVVFIFLLAYFIIRNQRNKLRSDREVYESRDRLSKIELENSRLKKEELELELNYKNKELTSYTMNFIQKNELIQELKEAIQQLMKSAEAGMRKDLNKMIRLIDNTLGVDKDWENFKVFFEQVHQDFFDQLKVQYPELTGSDLKLCALVRLNLSMKETSALLGISAESVKTARYRLRKKLNLNSGENLMDFLMKFESENKSVLNNS